MEPRAHHVMIGLFTVIVIAIGLIFALWLGKYGENTARSNYVVVFNEPVRGLARGGAVQFNGIRVGEVVDLSIDPRDIRNVRALISIQSAIPVKVDTVARLVITGITGVSEIALNSANPDSPVLTATPEQPYPEIIASPSPLSQIMQNGDTLLTGMTELVHNANRLLSVDNADKVARALANLETVTSTLAEKRGDIDVLLSSMAASSKTLNDTLKAVNSLVATEGRGSLRSARHALDSVDDAATRIAKLVQENQGAVAAGMQGLGELGPTLQELRMTLATLRSTLRKLNDNPAGYLMGAELLTEVSP